MLYDLCYLFMIFAIGSILGYIVEVIFCTLGERRLVLNRGFLNGPFIPIYGVGMVLMILFLVRYRETPFAFFWMTVVLCSFIEYITSYIMEKLFKVRWWDYSDVPFNYNGRICLKNSMCFGLGGLFYIYIVYPHIENFLNSLSPQTIEIASLIILIIFLIDFSITTSVLFRVRNSLAKYAKIDATDPARNEVLKVIKKHYASFARLLKAFPNVASIRIKEFDSFKNNVLKYSSKIKIGKKKED